MLTEDQLLDTWQRSRHSITWVVQQRIGNRETAAEITCEAFCRAWKNREKWSPSHDGATADNWLFRIATNLSIDHARSYTSRTENLFPELFEEIHPTIDPIEELEARLFQESLPDFDTITAPCTPEQRRILDLRYRCELTYAAIGERVELSESACKSLVNRGLRKIREMVS
jgi:RNA polymerase sigma factor (sigma-70 family)